MAYIAEMNIGFEFCDVVWLCTVTTGGPVRWQL